MRLTVKKGVFMMAANFRISVHRNSDNLHLKLMGSTAIGWSVVRPGADRVDDQLQGILIHLRPATDGHKPLGGKRLNLIIS